MRNEVLLHAIRYYGVIGKLAKERGLKRSDIVGLLVCYIRLDYTKESFLHSGSIKSVFHSLSKASGLATLSRLEGCGLLRRADNSESNYLKYVLSPEGLALVKRFDYLIAYANESDNYRKRKLGSGHGNKKYIKAPALEGFFKDDPINKVKPSASDPGFKAHADNEYSIEKFGQEVVAKAEELEDLATPPQLKGWKFDASKI